MRVRRRTKSEDVLAPMPSLSASGSVRSPGEREPLKVKLTIAGTEVALRSGDLELGTWQVPDVEVSAVDATRFTFVAEGDRLIFTPDDPIAFASHPLVRPYPGSQEAKDSQPKRKRKSNRKRSDKPTPSEELAVTEPEAVTVMEPAPRHEDLDGSVDVPPAEIPDERSATSGPAEAPIPAEMDARDDPEIMATAASGDEGFDDSMPHEQSVERQMAPEGRSGPWIRTLDMARRNGLFGLDRVQVAEGLRGQEHQHTFDHGAAAGYGPSKHICTVCGKVRFRP